MLLIVGLGNPGRKYVLTRHNIGFIAVDHLAEKGGEAFKESKWDADLVKISLWSKPFLLAKPSSYMNLSGGPVSSISTYYRIPPERIVVIHDDLDLEVGRVKIVCGRGAGGHNGIKSLIEHLGTRDFIRFRVGIGRPPEKMPPASFVLSKFTDQELTAISGVFNYIEEGIKLIADDSVTAAMNFVNRQDR
jgi:PTH1 family peptidyl-tRNA hydrolase